MTTQVAWEIEVEAAFWIARGEHFDLRVIPGGAKRREGDPDFGVALRKAR
jgi:hypothetical protein